MWEFAACVEGFARANTTEEHGGISTDEFAELSRLVDLSKEIHGA